MFAASRKYRRPAGRTPFFYGYFRNSGWRWRRSGRELQRRLLVSKATYGQQPRKQEISGQSNLYRRGRNVPEREWLDKDIYAAYYQQRGAQEPGSLQRQRRCLAQWFSGRRGLQYPFLGVLLWGALVWAILSFGRVAAKNQGSFWEPTLPQYPINQNLPEDSKTTFSKGRTQEDPGFPSVYVNLLNHQNGQLLNIELEEYVVGVVAAEMPASFELEALKAQAVVARTYALSRVLKGASPQVKAQNPRAQLTSDHQINQAWIDQKERKKRWGDHFPGNETKIRQAVAQTRGIILLFQGQIIDPLYHASCGGQQTEDIVNVWGKAVPYLKAASCSGHRDKYRDKVRLVSLEKVDQLLGTSLSAVPAGAFGSSKGQKLCQIESKTASGRVMAMVVMNQTFTGAQIRSKLELPSASFSARLTKDGLEIMSQGYGHGVGMCQYGATDFAAKGEKWPKILARYYEGTQAAQITLPEK